MSKSHDKAILAAWLRFTGGTLEALAGQTGIGAGKLQAFARGPWPLPTHKRDTFAAHCRAGLRAAYRQALGATLRDEELRTDPNVQRFLRELADAYRDLFGADVAKEVA